MQLLQKPKIVIVLIVYFFTIQVFSFAQLKSTDSISKVLAQTQNNQERKELLLQLGRSFNFSDRELSVKYYSEALQYETNPLRRGEITDSIGLFNWGLGNYNEAILHFNKAMEIFSELNDSLWLGKINNNIAVVKYGLGHRNEALEYYQTGLKIRKAIGDKRGISNMMNNIGKIYNDWRLYEQALQWHNDALEIALAINDTNAIAYTYSNIGDSYVDLKEYEKALRNYIIGYDYLLSANPDNRSNSFFSACIGDVYSKMNLPDSALFYFQKAKDYAIRINNKNRIAIAQYLLGRTYYYLNQLDSAQKHLDNSYKISLQNHYMDVMKDDLFILSELEERKGNATQALKYLKNANQLKDSIFNEQAILDFTELQIKYYQEQESQENVLLKKDIEIQRLTIQRQKNIRYIFVISSIFFLIILFFILRNRAALKKLNIKLKESEKELIKVNANKDKFFTIIAHDLKSPFNGLLGITELLNSNFDDLSTEKIKQMIHALDKSASKVYALLEGLLQWAQIQAGKMEYHPENIDVCASSKKVIDLLSANAARKKVTLENKITECTIISADRKAFESVLRNIISNAIKFTHSGGLVQINSEENEIEVLITISDNGVGMSDEIINNLFRIEVQNTTVGTNNEAGTGLGLILCKELVEKNGGKIWVESKPGKGSKFSFSFPIGKTE
jgi:signal transduction histidine kinase